ncbi:MAG: prolipoprotein diacylglyceryl transferase [Proteobacteria bacterium]|nr:prolipoprotein diacylglyceryl transferase [Pseudomonadota bacterium]
MLQYPEINPVILHITDALQIRWYGVMYLLGFGICWLAIRLRTKTLPSWKTTDKLNDLIFYSALGVILGGRIGYMLFYSLPNWIASPTELFKIWQGGMSFHGGLIGVIVSTWFFCKRYHDPFWEIGDIITPSIPLALAMGRIGNFINGELWGRMSEVPWAMVFPNAGPFPRHPSQLYAVLLEGVFLFCVLWIYSSQPRKTGAVSGLFLVGYGCVRIFEEFFRQPDPQYGYIAFGWLTMGQILCLPMIIFGLYLLLCYGKTKSCFISSRC